MHYVYMVKNSSDQLYVGITESPKARVHTHNARQGAKFTKYVPNFEIVFLEQYDSLKQARVREIQIKKWRGEKKGMLIERYKKDLPTKQ